jgi:hypothetical protein
MGKSGPIPILSVKELSQTTNSVQDQIGQDLPGEDIETMIATSAGLVLGISQPLVH